MNARSWCGAVRVLSVGGVALMLFVSATLCAATLSGLSKPCVERCYDDVVVTGSGVLWANGVYEYIGVDANSRPMFWAGWMSEHAEGEEAIGQIEYRDEGIWDEPEGWYLRAVLCEEQDPPRSGCTGDCWVTYYNPSPSSIPPSTGWTVLSFDVNFDSSAECKALDGHPVPTLSGGAPCDDLLVPVREEGFLDRGWPEGEAEALVGDLAISAQYEVGEAIGVYVEVVDASGIRHDITEIALFWIPLSVHDEYVLRLESYEHVVTRDANGGPFRYTMPTDGYAPGYYDIWISLRRLDCVRIRVELVTPVE